MEKKLHTIREASEEYKRIKGVEPHLTTTREPLAYSTYGLCKDAKSKADWLAKETGLNVGVV